MAEHFQTGVRNLYRRFKAMEQPTPNEFIKNQRITVSAHLLLTTNLTVQEVMYRCGFSNRSHYYKEFSKKYGMTPKAYRESAETAQLKEE